MSFVYPAGLIALLGVGVLIFVVLLKRKHEETTLSSTYLWRMAQQYQKENQTVQRLKKALVFVLELLCVMLAALLIAQPVITLPGADTGYVAILDGSGSMRLTGADGKTRFARAQEALVRDIDALPWGSRVTVILAGDGARTLVQGAGAGDARAVLEGAQCGYGEGDLTGALALCQTLFDAGEGTQACLYTDREYPQADHIGVVTVRGEGEWNVSVSSLESEGSIYGTEFIAGVTSGGRDANVAFELYLDGEKLDADRLELFVDGQKQEGGVVYCPADETIEVRALARQTYSFSDARIAALAQDGLTEDNEYRLYAEPGKTTRVLLAGENTYFLERALSVFGQADLTAVKEAGRQAPEGYDIYVFDGCMPDTLPQGGAVWLINPPRSLWNMGLIFGEEIVGAGISPVYEWEGEDLSALTRELALHDAAVVRFKEVSQLGGFEPALLCGRMPALLAGRTEGGYRMLVMPFDLNDSNLPLLADYIVLLRNMLDFSVPPMLPGQNFACGETVYPRTLERCEKLFLQTPDMTIRTLGEEALTEGVSLTVPGGYTLLQELAGGEERVLSFFAHMPQTETGTGEAEPAQEAIALRLPDEDTQLSVREDQRVNPLRLLAAALLLLACLEWVVYHREKY
ncbi:MAG: BatA and WFA domain-containing protein [Clostridia bacterium]|nr:BatA and WFA domain-containing protein [Clostridia bacterium]